MSVDPGTQVRRQPRRSKRLRADAAANRLALMQAARRLIEAEGVENLTTDAVAAEAGVGKGTLFRHFGSRQGLAAALVDALEADWEAGISAQLGRMGSDFLRTPATRPFPRIPPGMRYAHGSHPGPPPYSQIATQLRKAEAVDSQTDRAVRLCAQCRAVTDGRRLPATPRR
jgi:AcrR family transcriptional regulator